MPLKELKYVVFYDKPMLKFERLLETYVAFAPKGIQVLFDGDARVDEREGVPEERAEERAVGDRLRNARQSSRFRRFCLPNITSRTPRRHFIPSPFERAAVLCMDGVGEWATTSAWLGDGRSLTPLWEISFPHSLGLLYSAFTYYTGFKVNSGEYKVMGLAPYGRPQYVQAIYDHLLDLKPDGTFRMNMDYFNYCTGLTMTNGKFDSLFDGPPRKPETPLTQREMDLARSVQDITEEVMLRLARSVQSETGAKNLCLAGGVALNCVGNGRILREGPFEKYVDPARRWRCGRSRRRSVRRLASTRRTTATGPRRRKTRMRGGYLGPAFGNDEIERFLRGIAAPLRKVGRSGAAMQGGRRTGRGESRWLATGPDGVRSAGARRRAAFWAIRAVRRCSR